MESTVPSFIAISCWNCHGLQSAILHIRSMIDHGSDIIILSEHWLWPFELHKLDEIDSDYAVHAVADRCLTVVQRV